MHIAKTPLSPLLLLVAKYSFPAGDVSFLPAMFGLYAVAVLEHDVENGVSLVVRLSRK